MMYNPWKGNDLISSLISFRFKVTWIHLMLYDFTAVMIR